MLILSVAKSEIAQTTSVLKKFKKSCKVAVSPILLGKVFRESHLCSVPKMAIKAMGSGFGAGQVQYIQGDLILHSDVIFFEGGVGYVVSEIC